jgi:hypothetical protein
LLNPVPGEEPRAAQERASRLLPERLMPSPMDWWPVDATPHGPGNRLLIGVAVWSGYDLRMLDLLEEAIRAGRGSEVLVGVFDIDRVGSLAELERLLPGIGTVPQTPLVGLWSAGAIKEVAQGFQARQLVSRLFGIDPQAIIERPAASPR